MNIKRFLVRGKPPTPPTPPAAASPGKEISRRALVGAVVGGAAVGAVAGRVLAPQYSRVAESRDAYEATGSTRALSGDTMLELSPAAALARRIVLGGETMEAAYDAFCVRSLAGGILAAGSAYLTYKKVLAPEPHLRRRAFFGAAAGMTTAGLATAAFETRAEKAYMKEVYNPVVAPAQRALKDATAIRERARELDARYFETAFDRDSPAGEQLRKELQETYEYLAQRIGLSDRSVAETLRKLEETLDASIER